MKKIILSVDTASKVCSVSLLKYEEKLSLEENFKNIKTYEILEGVAHSNELMPLVKKVIKENEIMPREITNFTVTTGPRIIYWN